MGTRGLIFARIAFPLSLNFLPLVFSSAARLHSAVRDSPHTMGTKPQPPVAKKVEHVMKMFGDVRVDNYYWLRDDSRSNPEVLSYLQQENAYSHSLMAGNISLFHFLSLLVALFLPEKKDSIFHYSIFLFCKVPKSLKMGSTRRSEGGSRRMIYLPLCAKGHTTTTRGLWRGRSTFNIVGVLYPIRTSLLL